MALEKPPHATVLATVVPSSNFLVSDEWDASVMRSAAPVGDWARGKECMRDAMCNAIKEQCATAPGYLDTCAMVVFVPMYHLLSTASTVVLRGWPSGSPEEVSGSWGVAYAGCEPVPLTKHQVRAATTLSADMLLTIVKCTVDTSLSQERLRIRLAQREVQRLTQLMKAACTKSPDIASALTEKRNDRILACATPPLGVPCVFHW